MIKQKKLLNTIKRIYVTALLTVAALTAGCSPQNQAASGEEQTGSHLTEKNSRYSSANLFAMDTIITIQVHGGEERAAISEVEAMIGEMEKLWSVTDDNSELYRANHSMGGSTAIGEETEKLVSFALDMADETDGALNPALYPVLRAWGFTTKDYRIPGERELGRLLSHTDYRKIKLEDGRLSLPEGMEIDLGAVAKGYAGDLAADIIRGHGVTSAIVNLGGNVGLIGSAPDGQPWTIGIRNPNGDGNIGTLEVSDCNIITSGGYERYFTGEDGTVYWHILDPETGMPAKKGLLSVTVVGQEGRLCDALSTALFVMGKEKAEAFWKSHEGFEMILMTDTDEIYITEGLKESFKLNESDSDIPLHIITK